jgi:cytoskeletal protein CcmA (bactofilin family)
MLSKTKDRDADVRQDGGAGDATNDVSIISSDMLITGECDTRGQLRIEGRIAGNISASGVELTPSGTVDGDVVAKNGSSAKVFVISGTVSGAVRAGRVEVRRGGSVKGGVVADEAVIHGRVHGGVQAKNRLALEESAEVEGDVLARRLALKEGGRVNGNIRMGDDVLAEPSKQPSAKQSSPKQPAASEQPDPK